MDIQKIQQYKTQSLIQDLRQIIEQARGQVAATANYAQTMMYWHIGERINREVLGNQRAEYGKQIVSQVATQLQNEYGKNGFENPQALLNLSSRVFLSLHQVKRQVSFPDSVA